MLYLSGDGIKILILESANLDELRNGRPLKTPDRSVVVAWTPDPVWLADRILDTGGDAVKIGALIDEAAKRPEKPGPRPYHKLHTTEFVRWDLTSDFPAPEG